MAEIKKKTSLIDYLQNMDAGQFIQQLSQNKIMLMQVLLVVATMAMSFGMLQQFMRSKAQLEEQIKISRQKISVIDAWQQLDKQHKQHTSSLPAAMDAEGLIGYLSDLANNYQVEIVSYTPGEQKDTDYYESVSVDIVCNGRDFKSLVLFLQAMETDARSLRVQSLKMQSRSSKGLNVQMQVVSKKVKIKA